MMMTGIFYVFMILIGSCLQGRALKPSTSAFMNSMKHTHTYLREMIVRQIFINEALERNKASDASISRWDNQISPDAEPRPQR